MGWRGCKGGVCRWALVLLLGCFALLLAVPGAYASVGTGKITGLVKEAALSHKVIADVDVFVFDASSRQLMGIARTNEFGEYTVEHLVSGSYDVGFFPDHGSVYAPQFYKAKALLSEATSVAVAEGKATEEINAELNVGGKITGTVTDASSHELENIEVYASKIGSEEFLAGEYADTNSKGEYEIVGLQKGSYDVEFIPGNGLNFVPQYYKDTPLFGQAEAVMVTEEATTSGIDAKLQEGGEITGRVTDAYTHKPLAGISIYAESVGSGEEGFGGFAETNANGEYTVAGLGNGTYKVEFESEFDAKIEYITQYYNDQATFGSANLVTVTQGSTTPGINAAMVPKAPVNTAGPAVSGTSAVGQTLSCANGSWTGEPKPTFTHTWLRNGSPIAGATSNTYAVQAADQGAGLACKVTARNEHGTSSATSNTLTVPPVPPPPLPTPIIEFPSSKLVVSGNSTRVPIVCAGATCTGTIELTGRIVVKHRKGRRTISKKETVVLAKGSYSLAAGTSATIAVRLTSAGKSALAAAKHHRLSAKLSASVLGGVTHSITVVLSEPVPKPKPKHGHR